MMSNKPYLIRAFYEWIVDNKCTPFIVINATYPRCKIPQQFVEDGQITLNVSPDAVRDLKMGNQFIEFRASFSSIVHIISAPVKAVLAVYAHENGQGMFFDFEDEESGDTEWSQTPDTSTSNKTNESNKKNVSHLKLVE